MIQVFTETMTFVQIMPDCSHMDRIEKTVKTFVIVNLTLLEQLQLKNISRLSSICIVTPGSSRDCKRDRPKTAREALSS